MSTRAIVESTDLASGGGVRATLVLTKLLDLCTKTNGAS